MLKRLLVALAATVILAAVSSPADARHHSGRSHHIRQVSGVAPVQQFCEARYCGEPGSIQFQPSGGALRHTAHRQPRVKTVREARTYRAHPETKPAARLPATAATSNEVREVDHPAGCPPVAFCGCGTSLYLLGKAVREGGLAIAREWLGFPRAAVSAGMAVVTGGGRHVYAIIRDLGGGRVLAYDPNAGRHRTLIHVREIGRRDVVVDPHGSNRYATAS